jgi:hypothetical protein
MNNRILFASAYGLFPMLEFELAIMSEFHHSDEIYYSRCNGNQKRCSANNHDSKILKKLKCLKCKSRVNCGLNEIQKIRKIIVINRNDKDLIDEPLSQGMKEILHFSARSNAMTDLHSSELPPEKIVDEYFRISMQTMAHYIKIIQKYKINLIYIYNGRLAEYAPLVWYCNNNNIDYFTYEYPMYGDTNYTLANQGNVSDISFLSAQFRQSVKNKSEEDEEGRNFFDKRLNRMHNDISTQFLLTQKKGDVSKVNEISNSKKIISIFTSNEIEYSGVQEVTKARFYSNQSELISKIVKKINDKYNLIIRIHPNAKYDKYHVKSVVEINDEFKNVMVFNQESKIDSYELIRRSSLVICFGSTIGIESMYLKIPSICIGPSIYSKFIDEYNNIITNESFEDFLENIDLIIEKLSNKELLEKNYKSACKYGFAWKNSGINSKRIISDGYGKIKYRAIEEYINFKSSLKYRIMYKILKGVIND